MRCNRGTSRNRIRKTNVDAWAMSAPLAVMVLFGIILAVMYSVLMANNNELFAEISDLEKKHDKLLENRSRVTQQWVECKSPDNLGYSLRRHGIAMAHPSQSQVVSLQPISVPGYTPETFGVSAYVSR